MKELKKSYVKNKEVVINRDDLPLYCPRVKMWDGHPKIYLDITVEKKIVCPYCGTIYKLSN